MSSDSREFGFVPENNLKGIANFTLWPPSYRWGKAFQPPYPFLTLPRIIIWSTALLIALISFLYNRNFIRKPLKF